MDDADDEHGRDVDVLPHHRDQDVEDLREDVGRRHRGGRHEEQDDVLRERPREQDLVEDVVHALPCQVVQHHRRLFFRQ